MSIGILKFNLPEEREDFELAQKAAAMSIAIENIGNEVFRPARKHGYGDEEIQTLIGSLGESKASELIGLLEQKFYQILEEYGVNK